MFKQILIFLILLLCHFSTAFAAGNKDVCPSIEDIKQGQFSPWLPLYKGIEELASDKDVELFKKYVVSVEKAKWSSNYAYNAHCSYNGKDLIFNKIVFARRSPGPEDENPHWVWKRENHLAECKNFPFCIFKVD